MNRHIARPALYLIDASSYVFRAFHAIPPLTTAQGLPTNAAYGAATMFLKFLREQVPEYAVAVFDAPGPTFRDGLFAEYKANRPPTPDELQVQLPFVRRMVAGLGLPVREEPGVEADDVIGTLARQAEARGVDVVIVTGDKDMMQLVGDHVSLWDTMRDRWTRLDDVRGRFGLEPHQLVDVMALMGDSSDNIPGVAGIGEKTATALIRHYGTLEKVLASPEDVGAAGIRAAGRVAAAIAREAEVARLSRLLATIRCDLRLTFDLEQCRCRGPQQDVLRPLLAELEFFSLLRDLETRSAPLVVTASAIGGADAAAALAERVRAGGLVTVAAAWSSPRPMKAELTELAVATANGEVAAVNVEAGTAVVLGWFRELLGAEGVVKVGENLKSLAVVAGRHGMSVAGPFFDTAVASYLLDPTREGHGLELLAERFLGASLPDGAAARALAAYRLRSELSERLANHDALRLFQDVEMPLVGVLANMERRGVLVDTASLQALSAEYAARLAQLMDEIHELAGGEFNIHSPVQLRSVLFDRLGLSPRGVRRGKTGLSTDVDVLTRLAQVHPLPARILEYRALAKLKSTYVDALPSLVNPETGRIHTSLHQTVTATGRLSSSDPNLQNIPVRGQEGRRIRAAFRAEPGRVLLSADYSQIELRILAHLSADPVLIEAFRQGEDIHARTAAEVFGGLAAMGQDARRAAKAVNFGIIYGMGPTRLARDLGIPQHEAVRYIRRYFQRYAGVQAYIERTVADARERGFVLTLLNRRRYLPDMGAGRGSARQFAERTAVNTPIQGSAADLIKMAMLRVDARLRRDRFDAAMVLQVHDELVFEVASGQATELAAAVRAEMEGVVELQVPLLVEVRTGENWAEAH